MTHDLFGMLVRISVILAVSGIIAWCVLRITHCRSARLHRVVWGIVLLQGVLWVRVPLELPVLAPEPSATETMMQVVDNANGDHDIMSPAPSVKNRPVTAAEPSPNFWQHATLVENVEKTEVSATTAPVTPQNIVPVEATPKIAMRFETVLLAVWVAGMCVVLLMRAVCVVRVLVQLRNAVPASNHDLTEWQAILHDAGLRPNKIRILITERLGPAMIWLPTGYCVLVPRSLWEESDDAVRRGILRHELSHYTHRDGIKSTLAFLIAAMHWFNPMAWFALKRFGDAAEWRCDREAYGDEPDAVVAFAESMLALHKTADRYVAFLPAFKNRDLTVRIRKLQEHQTGKRESIMKKLLITGFAALLLCVGALKVTLVAKPAMEETQPSQKEAKVIAEEKQNQGTLDPNWVEIKGKAVFPDGTPAERCEYMLAGHGSTSGNALKTDDQGRFSIRTFPAENFSFALLDPKGEWATPVQTFAWEKDKEIVFEFEKGVNIEGTVRDEKTGHPIPNMSMTLWCIDENENTNSVIFMKDCDENGHFSFYVMPQGTYLVTVGMDTKFMFMHRDDESYPYGKNVKFDDKNDVTTDFNIPAPFVGQVLRVDGKPAPGLMVHILNYPMLNRFSPTSDQQSYFVTTDREGRFRTSKRPQNVVIKMLTHGIPKEAYINWFDDDLPKDQETVFQLRPSCEIKGRLFDAAADKPLANQLLFYGYSDINDANRREFTPDTVTTDADGYFAIRRIPADVRYNLFIVPGRQEGYGGGPHEPYVEIATVVPEKDGETVELGDFKLDLTNTKTWPKPAAARIFQSHREIDPEYVTIKGKAILPDGTPAHGFNVVLHTHESKPIGRGGMEQNMIDEDGTFTVHSLKDSDCMIAIFDKENKWAAPYQFFSVGQTDPEQEVTFAFERGVTLEGTVKDKETGKPVANQMVRLVQCRESDKSIVDLLPWISFERKTDKEGHYAFQVVPKGKFFLTVDNDYGIVTEDVNIQNEKNLSPERLEAAKARRLKRADYGKKVVFDDGPVTTVDFKVPSPFYGLVKHADGSRAKNAFVQIVGYQRYSPDRSSYFLETDNGGGFVCIKRPQNVSVKIDGNNRREVYINWFDDDWPQNGRPEFQLRSACTIKARLLDAKTGEPLKNQLYLYGYSDVNNPKRKEFFPGFANTDAGGKLTINGVAAGVRYNLYLIPELTQVIGDMHRRPYVELKTLVPEKDGETIDLGDIAVDLTQTIVPPVSELERPEKMYEKWAKELQEGTKKNALLGWASGEYYDALTQLLEKAERGEAGSLSQALEAYCFDIKHLDKMTGEEKQSYAAMKSLENNHLSLWVKDLGLNHYYGDIDFKQLRGEKDSPWSVPADDPSNQGDWKNSPTGINPKILENFLRDCLQKK